jgi:long-subunit fatty acid transport protein
MSETNARATLQEENALKRKSDDVGWEYGSLFDPSKMDKVKCMFCNHVSTGGVYRLKQHVAHVGTNVVKSKKESSQEAKDRCKKSLEEASNKRREEKLPESLCGPVCNYLFRA